LPNPSSTFAGPALEREEGKPAVLLHALVRLCAHLERPLSPAEVRAAAPVPESGDDVAGWRHLADRLGFSFTALAPTRRRLLKTRPPFIVEGTRGDAWLVRGRSGRRLVTVEAERGTVEAAEAEAMLPRVRRILVFKPVLKASRRSGRKTNRAGAEAAAGATAWREAIMKRLRPVLWQIGIASVFINILALATPLFMMTVYNKVVSQGALRTLDVMAIGMVSLFAFDLLLRGLRGYVMSHTGAKLDVGVSRAVVHHLLALPYRAFEAVPSGQMLERLRQLDRLRQFLTGNLPLLLVDLAFVGIFVATIFYLDTTLGMVTAAAMPLFILLSWLAHRRQGRFIRANFRASAGKASALGETVAHALTVKALGLEPEMEKRFEAREVESAWTGYRAGSIANMVAASGQVLQHLTTLLIVYLGARAIVAGELSIGALIACTILSARALAPMRQIFFAWHQLQETRDAFARLGAIMREETEQRTNAVAMPAPLKGHIRLEGVGFSYAAESEPALADISLEIDPGSMLALVGPAGSGKTTLAKMVMGLEKPDRGRITVDGLDLSRVTPASYRSQVGVVPQEIQLFAATVAENIAMGAEDQSIERVVAAAKFVGAHDFIQRLADGYDTMLSERGGGLSVGQRQMICIARALVRNPRLLILDEATSALDQASEALLLRNLRRAGSGRTIIMITHRVSVLEACDRAVLLENGRIRATGSPAEITEAARAGAAEARRA